MNIVVTHSCLGSMAGRHLNTDLYVRNLKQRIADLESEVNRLNATLIMERNGQRRPSQMLRSAVNRSQQHRRAREKLSGATIWVWAGYSLTIICFLFGMLSFGFSYIINKGEKIWPNLHEAAVYYGSDIADPRVYNASIGCLGIGIAVIGQRIFPAPWRTFISVFGFSIKQLADIFLPAWCSLLLFPGAFFVIHIINIDRKEQVRVIAIIHSYRL